MRNKSYYTACRVSHSAITPKGVLMFKKTVIILSLILLFIACTKKDNDNLHQIQVRSMQEISNEMSFSPQENQWQEFVIDQEAQSFTQEWQTTPGPASQTTSTPATPPPNRPVQTSPPPTPARPPATTQFSQPEPGEFTAQLVSSRDRNRVNDIRNTLNRAGYETEIQEADINGVMWYRLRLSGSFSRAYAEHLAQRIQSEFSEINDYWVTRR